MSHLCDVCREEWTTVGFYIRGRFIYVGQRCAKKIADLYQRHHRG